MTAPTKVLFLDIDGVLNSHRSCLAFRGYPHGFHKDDMAKFDHVAVSLIRRLCREVDCSIVLSSSWRIIHQVIEVANGLDLPIFDRTHSDGSHRGTQIKDWLDAHPEVTHYAIVDDDSDMLDEQAPCFVRTNANDGLTLNDYSKLKAILK